ncbi:hypothetical protein ACN27E_19325 [Mycobacterium sp. WMMD1722]|uniref:hypothetical protein n=1 Tax=Mycobacterium sp. WMMD1722 TaxID=3404117 RepID=UPI003BF4B817
MVPPMRIAGSGLLLPAALVLTGSHAAPAVTSSTAAAALPGTIGLLALTGLGVLLGYRQAKAGRTPRSANPDRFLDGG